MWPGAVGTVCVAQGRQGALQSWGPRTFRAERDLWLQAAIAIWVGKLVLPRSAGSEDGQLGPGALGGKSEL